MSDGMKFDNGKSRMELLSPVAMRGTADVLTFGAQKYTRYGKCDCHLATAGRAETAKSAPLDNGIRNSRNGSEKTTGNGSRGTTNTSPNTIAAAPETTPQNATDSAGKKSTDCWMPDARCADRPSAYVSTTSTQRAECAVACAPPVMSGSAGSRSRGGSTEHSPTCAGRKEIATGAHNWRKGIELSRLLGAALRHLTLWQGGEDADPESGLPHLDHAACCMMFLQELSRTRPDLDDRYVPNVQNARTPSEDLQRAFDQLNPSWNGPEHLKPEAARIERCDNPGCTWCGTHK